MLQAVPPTPPPAVAAPATPTPEVLVTAKPKWITGHATLRCEVTTAGRLEACKIIEETPKGAGVGQASLNAAHEFKVKPPLRDGAPVRGVITLPIRWVLPDGGPPTSTASSPDGSAPGDAPRPPR